jgi:hypothetical protein
VDLRRYFLDIGEAVWEVCAEVRVVGGEPCSVRLTGRKHGVGTFGNSTRRVIDDAIYPIIIGFAAIFQSQVERRSVLRPFTAVQRFQIEPWIEPFPQYTRPTRGRWWYKLTHVCQRWRNLILGSASYLDLSLVCTRCTPVADMLAHSLPLPLDIDYPDKYHITTEEEEEAILALRQRDRVRRVRLRIPITNLQKLIVALTRNIQSYNT